MSKIYLIYHDGEFKGYAPDKKLLHYFLKTRKLKYKVKKIKSDQIPEEIKSNNEFDRYCMSFYMGYDITYELPMFGYEIDELENRLYTHCVHIEHSLLNIVELLKYLNIDKEYRKHMVYMFTHLGDEIHQLYQPYVDSPFDELIDLVKYAHAFVIK